MFFLHVLSGDVAVFGDLAMQIDREDKTQKECRLLKANVFPIQHMYTFFCSTNIVALKVGKRKILAAETSTGFPPKLGVSWEFLDEISQVATIKEVLTFRCFGRRQG